jgi:glycine/D-amino acid oxidase-like deaminating enzyme
MGMARAPHVIVVGAGIIGACTAYFLAEAGARVTVLDALVPAAGASGASDGAVSVASKRPGPMMRLARQSRAMYVSLARDQSQVLHDVFHQRPTFLFARNALEAELIAQQGQDLISEGEHVQALTRTELLDRVPGLGPEVRAGLEVGSDGHALGYRVVQRMLAGAQADIKRHHAVQRIATHGGRVTGVVTDKGLLAADKVVITAGMGSHPLLELDAGDVLIPRKGQLIVTDRAVASGAAMAGPLMSAGYLAAKRHVTQGLNSINLVIDPLTTGQFLIGGSREVGVADRQTDVHTIATILQEALAAYPALSRQRVLRTFSGVRIGTRDGLPIVGRHPRIEGLLIGTGFEGDGICLAPLMGDALARLIFDRAPMADIAALAPARFSSS